MKGFTLIDILVGIALVLIVFLGIFGAFQLGLRVVGLSQNKITATALANQKLEEARNLPYQKVGIEGIHENGALPKESYYPPGTKRYRILVDVDCRNNPADDPDNCLCDYKTVTCTVSWGGLFSGEVSLATDIAPKNDVQECEVAGGVLEISVFNAEGVGVEGAEVKVEDTSTGLVNQCLTDSEGLCVGERGIFLDPSLSPENYKVRVSKSGYSKEETFASGDTYDSKTIANPEKPNATILQGQITEMSFSIDFLSSFSIETRFSQEEGAQPVKADFVLRGEKIVGTDSDEEKIYKYLPKKHTIDKTGEISDLEWDTYIFSDFKIEGESVELEEASAGQILPDGSLSLDLPPDTVRLLTLYLKAENTLLVIVQDAETKEPIFDASCRLYNLGYDKTQQTDEEGETLFIPLEEGTYNLEVTAEGYEEYGGQVLVSGSVTETINLNLEPD